MATKDTKDTKWGMSFLRRDGGQYLLKDRKSIEEKFFRGW